MMRRRMQGGEQGVFRPADVFEGNPRLALGADLLPVWMRLGAHDSTASATATANAGSSPATKVPRRASCRVSGFC